MSDAGLPGLERREPSLRILISGGGGRDWDHGRE
jgi:hypothetical protein